MEREKEREKEGDRNHQTVAKDTLLKEIVYNATYKFTIYKKWPNMTYNNKCLECLVNFQ